MEPRPELCVGAVCVRDGLLLVIKRGTEPSRGLWALPGGRVESGETMTQALRREVVEECGLVVEVGALVGWVERIAEGYHFVIFDFAVTADPDQEPTPGDDADEAAFVPLNGLATWPLVPGLLDFLSDHGVN